MIPVTETPKNAEATRFALLEAVTPNDAFFIRNHFEMPKIDAASWRLRVGGAVAEELALSLDQIRRLPSRTLTLTMECAGNGRSCFDPKPPGTPWGRGALSTASFTGSPLAEVLERARVRDDVVEAVFEGADRGETKAGTVEHYARSLPSSAAVHPDVLLAWEMNGEALAPEHGWPLRLVVPGWHGMASVKWLSSIDLRVRPFEGFFQRQEYVLRGCPGVPDETPVTRAGVNSLILDPAPRTCLPAAPLRVRGIAWSGSGPITGVEVSVDGGRTWTIARLGPSPSRYAHRSWTFDWRPARSGRHELSVRATDAAGATQPTEAAWNALGYCNNSVHAIELEVE